MTIPWRVIRARVMAKPGAKERVALERWRLSQEVNADARRRDRKKP